MGTDTRDTIEALGFEDIDTGGGCKAYYLALADDCYILLTSADNEMTLPEDDASDVDVGLYNGDSQPIRTTLAGSEYGGANVSINEIGGIVEEYRRIALGRMAPALLAALRDIAISEDPEYMRGTARDAVKQAEGRE